MAEANSRDDAHQPPQTWPESEVDRRTLLKRGVLLAAGAATLPSLVEACSSSSPKSTGSAASMLWSDQQVSHPLGLSSEGPPHPGGTLTWAWIYEPIPQMDPQMPTNGSVGDIDTFLWIYDQLTNIRPGTLTNEPGLAEHWDTAKGGLEYTFYLRDAEFSNGDKVTAKDVKFSLERFANPKINGQYAFLNAIDKVEALNPKTVRVTLHYVQAMFIDVVGHGVASIVPQRIVEAEGKAFGEHPVGSGAFVFDSKTPGQSISFTRNKNYWKPGKPYLDRLVFNYVPDNNARMLQVTSGQANVGYSVPYALLDQYRNHPGTRLQLEPFTNVIFVNPNIRQHPYSDRYVRLALNYATPREAINKAVFKNAPLLANSAIGQLQYWDPRLPTIPYDLAKARSYLKKSSVPTGFDTTLLIVGTDADSVQVASILQNVWREIGVRVHIEDTDLNTMFARVFNYANPNFQIVLFPPDYSSSDVGADDELAQFFYEPLSVKFGGYYYNDPYAAKLTNQVAHTVNDAVRKRLFPQLQYYCTRVDPPIIPIAFGPARTLVSSKVQGLQTLLNNSWRLENAWLKS